MIASRAQVLGKFLYPLPEEHHHLNGLSSELSWRARQQQRQECISLLKKCKTMEEFKQIHGQFLKLGLFNSSFSTGNLLATCALSSWGNMDHATSIFHHIDDRDSFEYNTMIRGHVVKDSDFQQGLILFVDMLEQGLVPDNYTYPFTLKACSGLTREELGVQIHGQVFKLGFEDDVLAQNGLINMYGKCGKIDEARAVFEQMEDGRRSLASWGSLISAHCNLGMWLECVDLFVEMNHGGKRYNRLGSEGLSILVSVLSACTNLGALDLGQSIHSYLMRNYSSDLNVIVETSLMDMYLKCGSVQKGLHIFETMREEKKNQQSYSVIISGLAMHGHGVKALEIFSDMLEKGLNPDEVVYLSVLSACRHSGLVEQGKLYFKKMKSDHGIEPTIQHYGCMIDLLGRAGKLEEALELITQRMPMEANEIIWRSLLSAAKVHHNLRIGEIAARKLTSLGSENAGDYVLMANVYAQAKRWEDMATSRIQISRKCLDQEPGFCMLEVGRGKMHKFVSMDKSDLNWTEVYEMIHQMEWQLKFEGYAPDLCEVVYDIDEEEKRERLRYHSQKLALGFALIQKGNKESPIRMVRNVRMCRDCHSYAKLVSVVYGREIVVRDRNRFHHIKAGSCSCKDYW